MAWPFLLYFLAWFTNEGVFFTSRTPPPFPFGPSPLLTPCLSFSWSCSDLSGLVVFLS